MNHSLTHNATLTQPSIYKLALAIALWVVSSVAFAIPQPNTAVSAAAGIAAGLFEFNSFTPDTLVHVRTLSDANNPQSFIATTKPISQLRIGDEVLALDEMAAFDAQQKAQAQAQAKQTLPRPMGEGWGEGELSLPKGETGESAASQPANHTHYEKITDIISSHKQQTLIHITLDNGEQLTATQGHPFKTNEGWRDAILLKKGGKLLLKGTDEAAAAQQRPRPMGEGWGEGKASLANGEDEGKASAAKGESESQYATITNVWQETKVTPVYNLEVANLHTFYVGEDGVVVHNAKLNPNSIELSHPVTLSTPFSDPRNGTVGELAEKLRNDPTLADKIPPVEVAKVKCKLYSANNRRLRAFQEAGVDINTVPASKEQLRKIKQRVNKIR